MMNEAHRGTLYLYRISMMDAYELNITLNVTLTPTYLYIILMAFCNMGCQQHLFSIHISYLFQKLQTILVHCAVFCCDLAPIPVVC